MALAFGWLTRKTGSVWPAAMAHGANNCISGCFILNPRGWGWDNASILVAAGLVGGLFALLALRRRQGTPALLRPAFG